MILDVLSIGALAQSHHSRLQTSPAIKNPCARETKRSSTDVFHIIMGWRQAICNVLPCLNGSFIFQSARIFVPVKSDMQIE